ncbi:hypothetical protein KGF57_004307 [Candida theae]|uniref:small monomeric GTPase n=1 Tax=Candida theae TaxID=1198502 RepID=A0AAD5BBE6_9ASCO|nr:uncharacterized protein KGF57_004307 [Candida theae]KAI5950492.1 hypothetical protein KGF57_004307 [Candida theae]
MPRQQQIEVCHDDLQVITKKYDACVLGSSNVGKSSMIYRFIHNQFIENIEDQDLYTKNYINKRGNCDVLTIYDSDFSNEMYAKSTQLSIINASCLIFAYAIDDLTSFNSLEDYFHHIKLIRNEMPPFFIVGCKSDLEMQRQVSYKEGLELANTLESMAFGECSAKENIGVLELFDKLTTLKASEASRGHQSKSKGSNITSKNHTTKQRIQPQARLKEGNRSKIDTQDRTNLKTKRANSTSEKTSGISSRGVGGRDNSTKGVDSCSKNKCCVIT